MIKKLDINCEKTAKEILALQKASYQTEADIIDFYDIPPLQNTLKTLMDCDEEFFGYIVNDEIAGIISFKIFENILDIHRVAIHPNHFRKGIAEKLVNFVETVEGISKCIVCTGKKNKPAVNLYLKNGYKIIEDIKIEEKLVITKFEKFLKQ